MTTEELIESYRIRLQTANDIADFGDNDEKTYWRLRTKAACYREFIAELTRLNNRDKSKEITPTVAPKRELQARY